MICPVCREDMFVLEFQRVELDWGPGCGGVWLDSGELGLLGEKAGALRGALLNALEREEAGKAAGKRRCPVCRKRLTEVRTGPEGTIVVDRCPAGHGLWFDRGELPAVVEAAGAEQDNVLARFLSELGSRKPEQSSP